jgi:hypothetical protein
MKEERRKTVWAGPAGRKSERGKRRENGSGPKRKRGRKRIAFKCI